MNWRKGFLRFLIVTLVAWPLGLFLYFVISGAVQQQENFSNALSLQYKYPDAFDKEYVDSIESQLGWGHQIGLIVDEAKSEPVAMFAVFFAPPIVAFLALYGVTWVVLWVVAGFRSNRDASAARNE